MAPIILFVVLAALPWILEAIEGHWSSMYAHAREIIDSGVTLLLGTWIIRLLRRERLAARAHVAELERQSITDPLTSLGNRRALERDLERLMSRSRRFGEPLALLYIDVDDMKRVNDRFGHASGDETLRSLGAVLRSSSRLGVDFAYRLGGDEFLMVMVGDRTGAESIGLRVSTAFRERSPHASTMSMGVVEWDGETRPAELLHQADSRMYEVKHPIVATRRARREPAPSSH